MTNESTELVLLEDITEDKWPEIYGVGKLNDYYERVKAEVLSFVPDLTTKKGREAIASNSRRVSTSKTFVEKPGRAYLKYIKETKCAAIEKELREFVDKMDALRDEARKPLTDWEQAEHARIEKHKENIQWFTDILTSWSDSVSLQEAIDQVNLVIVDQSFEEFESEAHRAKQAALDNLNARLQERLKYEAEQAELERLRKEAAEREQKEREERIAREAAEQARINAERAAAAEQQRIKDEAERKEREAALAIERAQREKAEAELREQQAKERAERERAQAEENARIAAENARQEEIRRQQQEQQRIADEQAAREKDRKHKAAVNNQILADLMAQGLPEECAKTAIRAIASGKVSNVSIRY